MSIPPQDHGPGQDEPYEVAEARRRSARPLVWLLLAIAALALLWYLSRPDLPEPVAVEPPVAEEPATPPDPAEAGDAEAGDEPAEPAAGAPSGRADPSDRPAPRPADRPAEPLARVQPEYPRAALRTREEGTVLLLVEVDADGSAASVEIESSSRSRELDRAAVEAVSQWTFRPAIEDGRPVASTVTVPVDFRID